MERDDQLQDILNQEHEAIEALEVIASWGFTREAEILASAAGLLSRWKQPKRREVSHIQFP